MALADRIRVFLRVRDEQIANSKDGLVAEVKLTDLSNSATTHVKWCPVSFDGNAAVQNEEAGLVRGRERERTSPSSSRRRFIVCL